MFLQSFHPHLAAAMTAVALLAASAPSIAQDRGRPAKPTVYKTRLDPHWIDGGRQFWYRNDLPGGAREFILVNAEKGGRAPAFDHQRLASALAAASGTKVEADRLPLDDINIDPEGGTVSFSVGDKWWKFLLTTYECQAAEAPKNSAKGGERRDRRARSGGDGRSERGGKGLKSPDGAWTAFTRDNNVFLAPAAGDTEIQLSKDGDKSHAYRRVTWSPDSKTLVSFRVTPGDPTEVYLLESSPAGGGPAKLHRRDYPLPGDRLDSFELNLFDVATRKQTKPQVEVIDLGRPSLHWHPDGHHLSYEKIDRGHQRLRLVQVDTRSGEARNLIDEKSDTFIWTAHTENIGLQRLTWLSKTDEAIYASERSGWRHLYLVDPAQGGIAHPITSGDWVVRGIDRIDEENRQIWFEASGMNPDQDPYFIHHYRVNFDGSGLVALTSGNGDHRVSYSPDRKYLIDSWSRVDAAPVHELRKTEDGSLVCLLEIADISELRESGWQAPEVFVAKGRDGKTDIWGVIARPADFDPAKKYPVIESIYAGPQSSYTPKSFRPSTYYSSLTEKGFVVVQMDGMGTANRSKAFHDVCWKDLKDAGFPDRIAWMKAAAKERPWMDLGRVGIYGTSAGGQNAAGAVIFHPEFYKAAVASCGCHDNRMDKSSWNEQWMGYPVGPQYAESSNIENANRLGGKLLLIVGEMDNNVPPESTYRLVDALIKADKDFDFLMVPGAGHGNGGEYGSRRRDDFFVKHLLGQAPPDRNSDQSSAEAKPEPEPDEGSAAVTRPPESFVGNVDEADREVARGGDGSHPNIGGLSTVAAGALTTNGSPESSDPALTR